MLTILWRKPNGAETLFSADSIERKQPDNEECIPAHGRFRAYGTRIEGSPADHVEFDIERPFGAVFVMNDKGQTVARYFAGPGSG